MDMVEKSLEGQLANIQKRTGRSIDELFAFLDDSGLQKHGQLRDLLKRDLGMGHGDANTVVHVYRQQGEGAPRTMEGELDRIYAGKRTVLRSVHDRIMETIQEEKPGRMTRYKVRVSNPDEVDDELIEWMRHSFESAG